MQRLRRADEQGIPFKDDVSRGVIETPAAVMISDHILAKEVDFFNIGTNDLPTVYTGNRTVRMQNWIIFMIHHEAVLRYDPDGH